MKISNRLAIYVLITLAVLVGVGVSVNLVYTKFQQNITATNQSREQQIKLRQKLSILQSPEIGVSKSDVAHIVIPSENPSLVALSQVRTMASSNGLALTSLSMGQPVKVQSLWKVSISFDVDGSESSIFTFISGLMKSAPILTVEKYKLTTTSAQARANVVVNYYWSPLPKQIPSVSESMEFTQEELEILDQMTKLTLPPKTEEIKPIIRGGGPDNSNPFER
jgi:Tfp pilus assembly protein PilO